MTRLVPKVVTSFLKCPQYLAKDQVTRIADLQNGSQSSTTFFVRNRYFEGKTMFFVEKDKKGDLFPQNITQSADKKAPGLKNQLDWKNIKTENGKTYCPYKWGGKTDDKAPDATKTTLIYYKNE